MGGARMPASDRELWRAVTRTVRPLTRQPQPPAKTPAPARAADPSLGVAGGKPGQQAKKPSAFSSAPPVPAAAPATNDTIPGIDRRATMRLRRGQLPIAARLDMHGMAREAAHNALRHFLRQSQTAERRCVLVITGKGRGILRRDVPLWLELLDLRPLVLGWSPAHARDGGDGALYILLRRRRPRRHSLDGTPPRHT